MTVREMLTFAEEIASRNEFDTIGIRFENKDRELGEICECSKDNSNREDERDFPEYGSEEYNELPELDGTSAYKIDALKGNLSNSDMERQAASLLWSGSHGYLIAGNYGHSGDDEGEVVIEDAKVLAIFF